MKRELSLPVPSLKIPKKSQMLRYKLIKQKLICSVMQKSNKFSQDVINTLRIP